ncbi:hypothetical protein [Paraliomyxa miuraensis]|uniref:hypothetical protein n=1 Tax=Paraliomyxa miuraensis TaxID=376150 RepID=UPI0022502B7F|nr:hypothetical protein [Paraliomyxa miuraensis]MCX4244760.1 hypothetical protein [Paraliomyxa miuraensis]
MSTAEALDLAREPIVVFRSVSGNGQTFALESSSKARVREYFGHRAHLHPRVSIAHETAADYDSMREDLVPQIIHLLTGVSREQLEVLGEVVFRDPVTEHEVPLRFDDESPKLPAAYAPSTKHR